MCRSGNLFFLITRMAPVNLPGNLGPQPDKQEQVHDTKDRHKEEFHVTGLVPACILPRFTFDFSLSCVKTINARIFRLP